MLVSEKFGGLAGLDWIFDHGPWFAVIMTIIADFGIICALMHAEGVPPWERRHYKTFLWNDTVFIPLYMGVAVVVLSDHSGFSGWYTSTWWHVLLLALGFVISFALEVGALKSGQYTMSQELSPSKLWHSFIFGIVFYWLASSIIPVVLAVGTLQPASHAILMFALLTVSIVGFGFNMFRDAMLPFPCDAHLEGSWSRWDWHRRGQYPNLY